MVCPKTGKGIATIAGLLFCAKINAAGFYLGAGFGESFNHYDFIVKNNLTGVTVNHTPDKNVTLVNVFAGYGVVFPACFYLGTEIGTNFPRRSITTTRPGVSLTSLTFIDYLRIRDYVTGDILPGYQINPCLVAYGRAGVTYSELTINQPDNPVAPGTRFNPSEKQWGGRFGAGIRYSLTNNFGISGDYIFTAYQQLKSDFTIFHATYSLKAHSNFIGLSLYYNFT